MESTITREAKAKGRENGQSRNVQRTGRNPLRNRSPGILDVFSVAVQPVLRLCNTDQAVVCFREVSRCDGLPVRGMSV